MARPRAARDKAPRQTAARKQAAAAAAQGITPLELLLQVMRQHYADGDLDKAAAVAEKAAPYVHAKLAQIDASLRSEVTTTHRFVVYGSKEAPDAVTWERWSNAVAEQQAATLARDPENERAQTGDA